MTTKTKLGIYSVAGIVAIATIASGFMFSDLETQSVPEMEVIVEPLPSPDAVPLYLKEHRSGLPIMEAIEVENPRLDNIDFQELSPEQFDFIWRAINNGATYVSDGELEIYDKQINEPKHRFMINDGESVKYYRLAIATPPLSYENHYIKVLEFAEDRNIAFKPLDNTSKTSISEQLDRPYRWISVDEPTALSLKSMTDRDGTFFSSVNVRGPAEFQIQYLGPLGDEFKTNSELVKILVDIKEQQVLEAQHNE